MTRSGSLGSGLAVLLAGLALLLGSCGGPSRSPSNIVLVTLDTTRADRLGCYGDTSARTPTLDSLAAQGVLFEQAVCSVPVTLPSHSSILTGLLPCRHGVRDNGTFQLGEEVTTLAEAFRDAGYQTAGFVSAFVLEEAYGTAQGFTTYGDEMHTERRAMITSREAVRWLEQIDRQQPFFLWVHYYDPHLPHRAPEPFRSMAELDPYDQEVAAMDASLGWLLGRMRALDLLANTDFLLIGDHGEGLGDHGEPEHGLFLYESTLRVPLLVVGHDGAGAGRRVHALATTQDVAPTLLELAGQTPLPDIDGISLVPALDGVGLDADRAAYAETFFPEYNFYHSHIFALRTPRWKLVEAPRPELYYLPRDPSEERNLIASYPDTVRTLRARLEEIRSASAEVAPAEMRGALSPEVIERLQSLGYLGGGQVTADASGGTEFLLPDPKDVAPYVETFARGIAALNQGRLEEARGLLEEVLVHNPENLIMRLNLGRIYLNQNETQRAIEQFREATVLAPTNTTASRFLALAYQADGQYDGAIEIFRRIADDPSQGVGAKMEIARTLLMMGRAEEAQLEMRSLADDVGGSPAFSALAQRMGDYIEAQARFEERPGDRPARLQLAAAALDLSLRDQAERWLDFEGADPLQEAERRRLLGSIAVSRGNYVEALREYEAAAPYLPGELSLQAQLGVLYLEAGRSDDALAHFEGLLRRGMIDPVVYYNKACVHALRGEIDPALEALRRAVNSGYDNVDMLDADPDLDTLRTDPRFLKLLDEAMERYAL